MAVSATAPAEECLIEANGVSKKYCRNFRKSLSYAVRDVFGGFMPGRDTATLRQDEFWAVKDVSFTLRRGDSLGLIGRNGAGKSTLLKMLIGQRSLTAGTIATRGRIVALTELGLGFDPVLSGRENAYVNAAVFGVSRAQLEPILEDIIDFAGIHEFIDSAVQTYSSGMKARLGFSIATHLDPDILIVDEVLAVGDLAFRRKCVRHIQGFLRRGGSMVLVAHDPYLVQTICNRCLVMEKGRVVFDGGSVEGVNLHFEMGYAGDVVPAEVSVVTPGETAPISHTGDGQTSSSNWLSGEEHPIVLDRFEVVPERHEFLATGGAAIVKVYCRSKIAAEVGWGFSVCTDDLGTSIFSCARGLDARSVTVRPGENEFRCRIKSLPLRPGRYAIRGGISDLETMSPLALLGFQESPNFFTVKSDQPDRTSNLQAVMSDLISVPVEWPGE